MQLPDAKSLRQLLTMRLMVTIPSAQGGVARVIEKKFQGRRFDVTVAEQHVGFALVARKRVPPSCHLTRGSSHEILAAIKAIAYRHHVTLVRHF